MSEVNWPGVAIYAVVITAIVFLFVSFSGDSSESKSIFDEVSEDQEFSELPVNSQSRNFEVRVSEYGISPSFIVLGYNDSVRSRARSMDGVSYTLTSSFGSFEVPASGEAVRFRFLASQRGDFLFVEESRLFTETLLVVIE